MKTRKLILSLLFASLIPVNLLAGCSETTRVEEDTVIERDSDVIIPDTAEENEDINVNIETQENTAPPPTTIHEESNVNITVPETKTENEEENTPDAVNPVTEPKSTTQE